MTLSLALTACAPSDTYGFTKKEYKLVDRHYKVGELIKDAESMGYSREDIERELRAALNQVYYDYGNE